MRIPASLVIVSVLAGASPRAYAEDVAAYPADGDADVGAADPRIEALDEAFGKAVAQAVSELVEPEVRRQHKSVIDRELLGHARLWVARFTVTKESVADERKRVSASVRIDRDKLRARLAELDIPTRANQASGDGTSASGPAVTVLLRVATPDSVTATYGRTADKDTPGLAAISGALRRANMVVKRAPASGPAAGPDGELPLDDDDAGALAAEAKADLVAIAGVRVGAPVLLRGASGSGVLVTAAVRLVDRKARKAVGQGTVVTVARGTEPTVIAPAVDRALAAAIGDVLPAPAARLDQVQAFTGTDAPAVGPGIVLVRLARTVPWGIVQSEIRHLSGARGVSRATLRHVSPAGWVIGVATTESIDRVAAIVKKPPQADTTVSVKIVGSIVEATLAGAP